MIDVIIENSDGLKSPIELGEIAKEILAKVRAYKTANKMSLNAPIDELTLSFDSNITTLDMQICGSMPYDIMGATSAAKLIMRAHDPYGPEPYAILKEFDWE